MSEDLPSVELMHFVSEDLHLESEDLPLEELMYFVSEDFTFGEVDVLCV